MSATDELRRLLDELGIKWKPRDAVHPITVWHDGQFSYEYMERTLLNGVTPYTGEVVDGTGRLEAVIHVCSPEQAIAATVDKTCKQEEQGWSTEGDHARVWLTCGHDCMVPTVADLPNFCPECGAKVVD